MQRQILMVFCILILTVSGAWASEVGGVSLPETLEAAESELVLNGGGIRTKFGMKMYVGGLYLQQKETDPSKIIESDSPMALRLHIVSSLIDSEKMENATREGFENSTNGNLDPLKDRIDKFIDVFRSEINSNDIYDMIYIPETGVEVYKNGVFASVNKGLDFKKALFGIWLSDKPAHEKLKKGMLGG